MNFSNFNLTPSAKACLLKSKSIAQELGHLKVIDLHLFSSIIDQENLNIDHALIFCDINKDGLGQAIFSAMCAYQEPKRKKEIYSPEILEIIQASQKISKSLKHEYIGVDHIFLAIINTRREICEFLESLEIEINKLSEVLSEFIKNGIEKVATQVAPGKPTTQEKDPISSCCENLNSKIRERGTFEIFGRDQEIDRAFEVLLRKNKSNVIFVGDAGVGKTAIVEGMAEKIVQRECPDLLLHKEIISLDIASVVSGTIYRGQMEEKIKSILNSLKQSKNLILFIDEIHTIIGSGTSSEGGLDMANILKPALSRGEISCIGATTSEEYKRFFEKDSALDRRFENINVKEPSKQDTKILLLGAKFSYEDFHTVGYSEEIIDLIIDLCEEYLPTKKFPDKAFDILDESGAKTKKVNVVRPQKAKDMEADLMRAQKEDPKLFEKLHKKYESILKKWGAKLEKSKFNVDKSTIYDIFANKLNVEPEVIENKKKIKQKGVIGF